MATAAHRCRTSYEGDGGAFYHSNTPLLSENMAFHEGGNGLLTFDASRVSPVYGRSNGDIVTPESLSVKFFIKF